MSGRCFRVVAYIYICIADPVWWCGRVQTEQALAELSAAGGDERRGAGLALDEAIVENLVTTHRKIIFGYKS